MVKKISNKLIISMFFLCSLFLQGMSLSGATSRQQAPPLSRCRSENGTDSTRVGVVVPAFLCRSHSEPMASFEEQSLAVVRELSLATLETGIVTNTLLYAPKDHVFRKFLEIFFQSTNGADGSDSFVYKFESDSRKYASKLSNFFCAFDREVVDFMVMPAKAMPDFNSGSSLFNCLLNNAVSFVQLKIIGINKSKADACKEFRSLLWTNPFQSGQPAELVDFLKKEKDHISKDFIKNVIQGFLECIVFDVSKFDPTWLLSSPEFGGDVLSSSNPLACFYVLNRDLPGPCTALACRFFNQYKFAAHLYDDSDKLFGGAEVISLTRPTPGKLISPKFRPNTLNRMYMDTMFFSDKVFDLLVETTAHDGLELLRDENNIKDIVLWCVNSIGLYGCSGFSYSQIEDFKSLPRLIVEGFQQDQSHCDNGSVLGGAGSGSGVTVGCPSVSSCVTPRGPLLDLATRKGYLGGSTLTANIARFNDYAHRLLQKNANFTSISEMGPDYTDLRLCLAIFMAISRLLTSGQLTISGQNHLMFSVFEPFLAYCLYVQKICRDLFISHQHTAVSKIIEAMIARIACDSRISKLCVCQFDHVTDLIYGASVFTQNCVKLMGGHRGIKNGRVFVSSGCDAEFYRDKPSSVTCQSEQLLRSGIRIVNYEVSHSMHRNFLLSKTIFPSCYDSNFNQYLSNIITMALSQSCDSCTVIKTSNVVSKKVLGVDVSLDKSLVWINQPHDLGCSDLRCEARGHSFNTCVVIAHVNLAPGLSYPLVVTVFPEAKILRLSTCKAALTSIKDLVGTFDSTHLEEFTRALSAIVQDILDYEHNGVIPVGVRPLIKIFQEILYWLQNGKTTDDFIAGLEARIADLDRNIKGVDAEVGDAIAGELGDIEL